MEIGGLEGVLIRAGEVSEAVPSLATAARSARESVTLRLPKPTLCGRNNQPMCPPSEPGGVGK